MNGKRMASIHTEILKKRFSDVLILSAPSNIPSKCIRKFRSSIQQCIHKFRSFISIADYDFNRASDNFESSMQRLLDLLNSDAKVTGWHTLSKNKKKSIRKWIDTKIEGIDWNGANSFADYAKLVKEKN